MTCENTQARVYYSTRLTDGLTIEDLETMHAECATIDELRSQCGSNHSPQYAAKQLHKVPEFPVVIRETFLLAQCQGKVVLDIGATGKMHAEIVKAAKQCYGITRPDFPSEDPNVKAFDLDDVSKRGIPCWPGVEVVVCGEVLEHLSNPGHFLRRLKSWYDKVCERPNLDRTPPFRTVTKIFTVPNAFSSVGAASLRQGIENVNIDHVSWYSYRTLRTLLERHNYTIREWAWYKGVARFSEGLICVAE